MKPIIIVVSETQESNKIMLYKEELEKIIENAYEEGCAVGRLEEKAKINTPYITQIREVSPDNWGTHINIQEVQDNFTISKTKPNGICV